MNARQKRFADEYLIDCNATQAAIRAGYAPSRARQTGAELVAKGDIRAYIDEQLEQIHSAKIADAEEVLEYLTSVVRGEHTEQVLKMIGKGEQDVVEMNASEKERLKAAELLGKAHGIFDNKTTLNVQLPIIMKGEDDLEE